MSQLIDEKQLIELLKSTKNPKIILTSAPDESSVSAAEAGSLQIDGKTSESPFSD